ncbi:MAG: hypothetical protein ACRDM1_14205 [Gaiellaceae bacterium]
MEPAQKRKAENEAVFRAVNERIEDLQQQFALDEHEPLQIVCECDRLQCMNRLSIDLDTYERVRSDSSCFFVVFGHEDNQVEDVVDRGSGYVIVRKRSGAPRELAERTDPRS